MSMDPAGERLKKIRLEKGLTLEQASKKTKVHIQILEALEEGRIVNKALVYVKGFLKIYCEFLGVEPEEFIPGYLASPEIKEDNLKAYQKKSILPRPSVKLSLFKPHFKTIRTFGIIFLAVILVLTAVRLVKTAGKGRLSAQGKKRNSATATGKKQADSKSIRLSIRARENCWIKAKVDGKVNFVDVLEKGRSETWQANDKIELSLGNAGGIELELNGEVISPLGRKGQVIRQIVISKDEGLKIIR
jgi:transcriptional regulator with XRE-family HTH domain